MGSLIVNPQPLNDPVTDHMRTDFARLRVDQTVGEALNSIREEPPEGRIVYFYVVDDLGLASAIVVAEVALVWLRSADVVVCLLRGHVRSGTIGRPFQ